MPLNLANLSKGKEQFDPAFEFFTVGVLNLRNRQNIISINENHESWRFQGKWSLDIIYDKLI